MKQLLRSLTICIIVLVTASHSFGQLNKSYFFYQSRVLVSQGKHTEAIAMLNQLLRADSTIAEAWFLRGVAKYYLNDIHGANADFSRAISHNPVFSQAYLYRAITYSRLSKFSQALPDYDLAIDLRPNSPDAYYSRGVAYLLMRNPERSISDLSRSIQLDPKNPDAWINRGTAHLMLKDTLKAFENYNQAIQTNPFYAEGFGKRGRLHMERKEYEPALNDLSKAISLDSTTSIHLFLRAVAYSEMDSTQLAIEDLGRALTINPENALALYNRGLLYWKHDQLKLALDDLNHAASLNPDNVLIYYNRASLLLDLDRPYDAIDDYTSAINLFPDLANAYIGRSIAHQRVNNQEDARRDHIYAQSISAKYSEGGGHPWTDTTKKFDHLIAFNSDFSSRSNIALFDEHDTKTIDILPLIRVIAVPKATLTTLTQPLDELNRMNSILEDTEIRMTLSKPRQNPAIIKDSIEVKSKFEKTFLEAIAYSNLERFNQAIEMYHKALDIAPTPGLVLINLAVEKADMANFIASFEADVGELSIEQRRRSTQNERENKTKDAITYDDSHLLLNTALDYLPEHPVIYYNKGNLYALTGWMDEALAHYQLAIEQDSEFAEAYYNKGLIHLMLRQNEDGCQTLGKAGENGIRQAYLLIHRFCR